MIDDFRPGESMGPAQQKPSQQTSTAIATHMPALGSLALGSKQTEPDLTFALAERTRTHHRLRAWFYGLSKKQKFAVVTASLLGLVLLGGGSVLAFRPHPKQQMAVTTTSHASAGAPVPTTVPSLLTGLPVDPSVNKRQVTGVMVENSTDARPQSGLNAAGVVFEAVAEGGVTRFLALFQDTATDYIGPVRSARPYYVQWCQSFDCGYAHVGGSPDALQNIKDWNIKDLNQFYGAGFFQRIKSRKAPHNVYTSIAQLNTFEAQKGYTSSTFTGFARLASEPKAGAAAVSAKAINFDYQGKAYDVHYDYDIASNSYKRSEGGAAHTVVDANGGVTQLSPKVVIGLAIPRSQGALDASHAYYSNYQIVGSGAAYIFQNGTAIHGTWTKASQNSQYTFLDDKGATIKLDPGQTWISALDTIGNATFN